MENPCQGCENLKERTTYISNKLRNSDVSDPHKELSLEELLRHHQDIEGQYRLLFEFAPDAIFIADIETGIILNANQNASNLLGIPVDQIIGMHQSQLHPPDKLEQYKGIFRDHVQQGGGIIPEDVYVQHKDGHTIPIQINSTVTRIGDKSIIFGIFRDMSQRHKILKELEASETRFKRLADAAIEGILIHDMDQQVININQQFLKMYGYTLEELIQTPLLDLVAPHARDEVSQKIADGFLGTYETFACRKDGTTFPVWVNVKETIINNKPARIVATHDLSEKKQFEQQLKAVFESSQDCILVWDKDYNYLYANQAAIDYVKPAKRRDEIIGKNIRDVLAHIPDFMNRWLSRIQEVFRTQKPMLVEDAGIVDDRTVYSESVLSPIFYPGGDMFAVSVVYRDITEQKAAEKKIADIARFPSENPDPVLRLSKDGSLLYANQAGQALLAESGWKQDQSVPNDWKRMVDTVFASKIPDTFEIILSKRVFSFNIVPIPKEDYVNLYGRDVTNQILLQNKLQTSEERYKRLAEATFDGIIIHEIDRIIDVNQQFADMFGYAREEIFNMDRMNLFAPESRDMAKKKISEKFEGLYEAVGLKKDGTRFPIEVRAKHSQLGNRQVRVAMCRDISDQKEAEEQARQANAKFCSLMKGLVDPAAIMDVEGRYVFMNDEALRRLGLTMDQVVGKNLIEIFGEESYQAHHPTLQKALETKTSQSITEQLCAQGETRWYSTLFHPIQNTEGQVTDILVISYDIHEKKVLEEKIKESDRKYKELYENAHVALFRTTLDGTLLHCNIACLKFLGYAPDELKENIIYKINVGNYYVDPSRRQTFIERLLKSKRIKGFEAELKKTDGSTFWASFSAEIFPDDGYIEGTIYDITIKKSLTRSERTVLKMLMAGDTNKQIALKLGRSVRTVEDHRSHVMAKLDVDNAFDLTRKVLDSGTPL